MEERITVISMNKKSQDAHQLPRILYWEHGQISGSIEEGIGIPLMRQ
ncbi:hypothetical protein [Synechococcus sp. LTW-R]|nr:hypothetical protein [Synechococcus sp. LTW-R]QNG30328.1 hypothetical protein H0O22_04200 [Synechococcus sp. LTW-R]